MLRLLTEESGWNQSIPPVNIASADSAVQALNEIYTRGARGAGRVTLAGLGKKNAVFPPREAVKRLVLANCRQFKPCFLFTLRFTVFTLDSVKNN